MYYDMLDPVKPRGREPRIPAARRPDRDATVPGRRLRSHVYRMKLRSPGNQARPSTANRGRRRMSTALSERITYRATREDPGMPNRGEIVLESCFPRSERSKPCFATIRTPSRPWPPSSDPFRRPSPRPWPRRL